MILRKFPSLRSLSGLLPSLVARGPTVLIAVLFAILMDACTPVLQRPAAAAAADEPAQARREAALAARPDWSLVGRVAVSQGGEGGSARIEWSQRGKDFDIKLAAPITRQSWTLSRHGGVARLDGLEGGPREGADAEQLLREATGWQLPVETLAAWVRGARADAGAALESDPQGRPALIRESGWTVEYRDWNAGDPPMPAKLFARKDPASVRLVIERWSQP